jgi:hypothetical protein
VGAFLLALTPFCGPSLSITPARRAGAPRLPGPCPEDAPCFPPDEWRLGFVSSPKEGKVTLYEVSREHLRTAEVSRYQGEASVFLLDGEIQRAKGGFWEQAAFGCQGKKERPTFQVKGKSLSSLRRGAWALVHVGEGEPAPPGPARRIGARLPPELVPSSLRDALTAWELPTWAQGATPQDAIIPLELDGDSAPEYWVTRHYRRSEHETPAPRMYSSWAIFDLTDAGAHRVYQQREDETDCLCRDGGGACCRWDETSASPAALFDADQDGNTEIVIERHARVGQYRYELWRFTGKELLPTRIFYEDGSC